MDEADESDLRVGAGLADITPALDVGILMGGGKWAPFEGIRCPLHARAVLFESGGRRVALVSLEILGISGEAFGGREAFKARIAKACSALVGQDDIILTATHTHSAPETMALTDLHRTRQFKRWTGFLAGQIGLAIHRAHETLQPVGMSVGWVEAPGLGIYRRFKTTEGIMLSHPEPPPEKVISREGPTDDSVAVACFADAQGRPIAMLVSAACHAVHEMCIKQISPDYPGAMSRCLEAAHPGATAMLLNGAAGNINPVGVSDGAEAADRHGAQLAEAVERALEASQAVPAGSPALIRRTIEMPGKDGAAPVEAPLAALRVGQTAWVFIPAEPFVEIGLTIRAGSPFESTFVVAYAEDSIGYIPVNAAFDEGGYELGPGPWARVGRGSAAALEREALAMLEELAAQ